MSKRSNQSERRYDTLTNERQGGSTNEKGGSVSSKKSWTNEKFEKLYEPVTVTELKRKRQMKQIRNHLRTMAPDLDKYVFFLFKTTQNQFWFGLVKYNRRPIYQYKDLNIHTKSS